MRWLGVWKTRHIERLDRVTVSPSRLRAHAQQAEDSQGQSREQAGSVGPWQSESELLAVGQGFPVEGGKSGQRTCHFAIMAPVVRCHSSLPESVQCDSFESEESFFLAALMNRL